MENSENQQAANLRIITLSFQKRKFIVNPFKQMFPIFSALRKFVTQSINPIAKTLLKNDRLRYC